MQVRKECKGGKFEIILDGLVLSGAPAPLTIRSINYLSSLLGAFICLTSLNSVSSESVEI